MIKGVLFAKEPGLELSGGINHFVVDIVVLYCVFFPFRKRLYNSSINIWWVVNVRPVLSPYFGWLRGEVFLLDLSIQNRLESWSDMYELFPRSHHTLSISRLGDGTKILCNRSLSPKISI